MSNYERYSLNTNITNKKLSRWYNIHANEKDPNSTGRYYNRRNVDERRDSSQKGRFSNREKTYHKFKPSNSRPRRSSGFKSNKLDTKDKRGLSFEKMENIQHKKERVEVLSKIFLMF